MVAERWRVLGLAAIVFCSAGWNGRAGQRDGTALSVLLGAGLMGWVRRPGLVTSITDAAVVVDAAGRVVEVNASARAWLGVPSVGAAVGGLAAEPSSGAALAGVVGGHASGSRVTLLDAAGGRVTVDVAGVRLAGDRMLLVFHPVGGAPGPWAAGVLEREALVGRLAGSVAHDVRNSLTVVLGNGDIMQGDASPEHAALLAEIGLAASRAALVMQNLLLLARPGRPAPAVQQLGPWLEGMRRTAPKLLQPTQRLEFAPHPAASNVMMDTALAMAWVQLVLVRGAHLAAPGAVFRAGPNQPGDVPPGSACQSGVALEVPCGPPSFPGPEVDTFRALAALAGGCASFAPTGAGHTRCVLWFPPAQVPAAAASAPPRTRCQVLVVEHDAMVRSALCQLLARRGYQALSAGALPDALQQLEAHPGVRVAVLDGAGHGGQPLALLHAVQAARPDVACVVLEESGAPGLDVIPENVPVLRRPVMPEELLVQVGRLAPDPPV